MATNRIGFSSDFVLVNSNVGVGTTLPTSKLTVTGDGRFSGIVTATQLDLTASSSANDSVLYLSGTPTSASGTNGLLGVGALNFSDTDIIANFTHSVNSYAQLVVQNKNSGASSSADIIVNNDRSAGTTYYGDFGINGTTFSGGGVFGDVDGTYLYSAGGTLSLGSLNSFDVKIATNNTERVRINATGVGIGTTNPTSTLHVVGNTLITGIATLGTLQVSSGIVTATTGIITYYGDGSKLSGVAAASADSYLFNTGVSSSFSTTLVGIGSTIFTFPSTAGKKYIVLSINCANVAAGNTEVNVIGAFDFNGGERSYFAYNIPIPTGTSLEIMKQPQVMNPSDKIVMRSTNFSRVGTNSIIETYVTYQEKTSTSYFGVGLGTVGLAVTSSIGIYTSTTFPSVVQSIRLTNVTDSGGYPVSVQITNGLTTTRLVDNLIIPKYANVEILDAPKRIEVNSVIQVQLDQGGTMGVQVSGSKIP
jgi:hypothetical protein